MDGQVDARTAAPMSRLRSLALVAVAALLELVLIAPFVDHLADSNPTIHFTQHGLIFVGGILMGVALRDAYRQSQSQPGHVVHDVLIRASTNPFVQHLPHFAFVVVGVIAYFWIGYRHRPRDGGGERGPRGALDAAGAAATAPRRVRRSVARRALLALAPLLGAVATGAVLYGLDVSRDRAGASVIWGHVGFSILALLLVGYKLKALGGRRLRHAVRSPRLSDVMSLVLGALLVPLLITGVVLLIAPSTGSFTAYLHLVASAWWTAMLVWHLWRYMAPAVRSAGATPERIAPSAAAAIPPAPAVAPAASSD